MRKKTFKNTSVHEVNNWNEDIILWQKKLFLFIKVIYIKKIKSVTNMLQFRLKCSNKFEKINNFLEIVLFQFNSVKYFVSSHQRNAIIQS